MTRRRRRVLIVVAVLSLAGAGVVAWSVADLPPPKYFLTYGLNPYCAPTGERVTLGGIEFVEIGPGVFRMGSDYLAEGDWLGRLCAPLGLPWGEHPTRSNEMPVHWVEFPWGFWIAATEVTNGQYERFDPGRTSWREQEETDRHPALWVSLEDARRLAAWMARETGYPIRFPTEAEWECACRAGSRTEFSFGDDEASLGTFGWHWDDSNSSTRTHPVASLEPNDWGLYDFHGNVSEWCEDAYHESYAGAPTDGSARLGDDPPVVRGGSHVLEARFCRSASRGHGTPVGRTWVGIRLAFTSPGK